MVRKCKKYEAMKNEEDPKVMKANTEKNFKRTCYMQNIISRNKKRFKGHCHSCEKRDCNEANVKMPVPVKG